MHLARLKSWLYPLLFVAGMVLITIAVLDWFGYPIFAGTYGQELH